MSKTNKDRGPHQAKNKVGDLNSKDNDFEVADNTADERKTVIVDKDFENLEFDDKVWLWWRENKLSVIVSIIAAIAIIVIFNWHKMHQEKVLLETQVAYNECKDIDSLESFVNTYTRGELSGIASLQIADSQYAKAEYSKALEAYASAAHKLNGTDLQGRAEIGVAFCQIKQGYNTEAVVSLDKVSKNAGINPAYRAEATYQLAVLQFALGEKSKAKELLDTLVQNSLAGTWAGEAQGFIQLNF